MRATGSIVLAVLVACGGGGGSGDSGDGGGDAAVDAPPITGEWQSLLEGEWSLAPTEEAYFCVYATVPRDIYLDAFRPLTPPGTHHTVLTIYDGSHADGTVRCDVGANGTTMIYGSGVGAPDFTFPTGVGLHLKAGTRLLLNLHLYNSSDAPLTGRSGALFREVAASALQHQAELVLAGPTVGLTVPTGVSTQSGTCQISSIADGPIQVFALSQHMHKLGRRVKSVVTRGNEEIVLQDIGYDFEKQEFHQVSPFIELRPGDVLTTYCTYENMTGNTVRFGESSDDEMCFTDLFYFPAQGAQYICGF